MWIQIALLLALAATTALTWYRASKQAIRPFEAVGWTVVWVAAAAVICLPSIASFFADLVGIGRGVDLVVYISVFVLFLLVFHLHVVHDRIEKSITELVRYDALRNLLKNEGRTDVTGTHG
jgi:hypothetical protein